MIFRGALCAAVDKLYVQSRKLTVYFVAFVMCKIRLLVTFLAVRNLVFDLAALSSLPLKWRRGTSAMIDRE